MILSNSEKLYILFRSPIGKVIRYGFEKTMDQME